MPEPACRTGRNKKAIWMALIALLSVLLAACGQQQSNQHGLNYKETKDMVIDILKTEEAKKAIEEAMYKQENPSDTMRLLSSPEGRQIQMAVKEVLTDPSYPRHLQQMMTDPKFAGEFAKAVLKENKDIHKQLLNDPEYQTMLLELMDSKEFKEIVFEVLKGKDYRKQTMTIMKEAMESPIFRMELMELLQKVIEEESRPKQLDQTGDKSDKKRDTNETEKGE